jgi:hypothetical protein
MVGRVSSGKIGAGVLDRGAPLGAVDESGAAEVIVGGAAPTTADGPVALAETEAASVGVTADVGGTASVG